MHTLTVYQSRTSLVVAGNCKSNVVEAKKARVHRVMEEVIEDFSYCLDAPELIPAGSYRRRQDLGMSQRYFIRPDSE